MAILVATSDLKNHSTDYRRRPMFDPITVDGTKLSCSKLTANFEGMKKEMISFSYFSEAFNTNNVAYSDTWAIS